MPSNGRAETKFEMDHTHVNRNNTNEQILTTASAIAYPPDGKTSHRRIMEFSEFHGKTIAIVCLFLANRRLSFCM